MAKQFVQIRIDHLGEDGLGYGHSEGFQVGVPGVVVNDIVDVELEHKNPQMRRAWGKVSKVVSRGPSFVKPACHHAAPLRGKCGGCPLMHVEISAQRQQKLRMVERALEAFPGYKPNTALRTTESDASGFKYRNRANYVVFRRPGGKIHLGSRAPRSTATAKMEGCLVNMEVVESVAAHLAAILNERDIPVLPARSALRYVTIRANRQGEALVDLITAQRNPGWMDSVVVRLKEHPAVKGISYSVNRSQGNAIRVNPSLPVWGATHLTEKVGSLDLHHVVDGFFQLNVDVAEAMYAQAAEWARESKVIWDLYCGVGGLGLTIARTMPEAQLFGCEFTESAVRLARVNARDNGLEGHFETADLGKGVPRGWTPADLIVVNPPRKGLDERVIGLIQKVKPRQVIYMSCSVESLKRDLQQLIPSGYRIAHHAAWDMMPHTEHVEALVVLDRVAADRVRHEKVQVPVDEVTGEPIPQPGRKKNQSTTVTVNPHARRFARRR